MIFILFRPGDVEQIKKTRTEVVDIEREIRDRMGKKKSQTWRSSAEAL